MNARRYGLWLFILIMMGILAAPTSAQDDSHRVAYDHIGFTYPVSLANRLQVETVEGVPYSENILFTETYPRHVRFSFPGYLGESQFRLPYPFDAPQILTYTTKSIREFGYDFLDQLNVLESLLQERPDLSAYTGASVRLPEIRLPFLPWINSAQVLRSHPQYVEIAGVGSGIRYVTYYSQESAYITDREIFYTFQGIMSGGNYYVSAILPVKTGVLPEEVDTNGIDWDEFGANYSEHYLPETFALIDSLPDDALTPSLDTLDALIQSITFETEMISWQTYTDVAAGYRFQYPSDRQICALAHSIELIFSPRYFDDPEVDHCALAYQANPISIIFRLDDDAFQAFRAENYPNSFVDYQEETISISGQAATRISGIEVETGMHFELFRFEYNGSYLIFRAISEENIDVLNQIISTLRFPISLS